MAEDAGAPVVGIPDPLEFLAHHPRNAVVLRQPLVHEGVVGRVELEETAVLAHQVHEEELRLPRHGVGELLMIVREHQAVRMHQIQVLQAQPLVGEAGAEGVGTRVGDHAPDLLPKVARETAALRQRHQFLVGRRAPEEVGEPAGQGQLADAVASVALAAGDRLEAEDEVGARQNRLQREAHAGLEAARLLALAIELHEFRGIELRERAPEGAGAEPGHDVASAGFRFFGSGGPAGEDASPNRVLGNAGHLERARNGQVLDVREGSDAVPVSADAAIGQRPVVA